MRDSYLHGERFSRLIDEHGLSRDAVLMFMASVELSAKGRNPYVIEQRWVAKLSGNVEHQRSMTELVMSGLWRDRPAGGYRLNHSIVRLEPEHRRR